MKQQQRRRNTGLAGPGPVGLYGLLRPLLFRLPPEAAHRYGLWALKSGLVGGWNRPVDKPPRGLGRRVFGLEFANPVGLAAGFDKNAEVVEGAFRLGFGFVEVGTVTPRPQTGNPAPRLFRLTAEQAIINRLGFNNRGHAVVRRRLEKLREKGLPGIVGVNIGANRDSADRVGDYLAGLRAFAGLADYLTVNISSPNTPGLRDLQAKDALKALLGRLSDARAGLPGKHSRLPLLVKIAPDISERQAEDIVGQAIDQGIDGLIVGNTTLARPPELRSPYRDQAGGLSGAPLMGPSTGLLATIRDLAGKHLALIGVGGIDGPAAANAKFKAGADLVQLYTGLVFQGPGLPRRILHGLAFQGSTG